MLSFHPMALLLKHEGYPPAVVAAAFLHGILIYFIFYNPVMSRELVDLDEPIYINAITAEQNPQRLRRIQEIEQQRARESEAQRQREQDAANQRAQEEEARQQEAQREADRLEQQRSERELAQRQQEEADAESQRQAREQQRINQENLERDRQAQIDREQEITRQAELQRQQALASRRATADARAVDTYVAIINNTVAGNWDIPPSARNGMTTILAIRLVPTGEVISVNVIQSSGNAAFDRSVEQAVRRAERFPELQDMSTTLFETTFRNLTITFRPEDLLR
ncbi:MAG: cell envelope integrity protein TolA [Gammaproteobacteria bacterium]|nr:cell envelope integrity protein TolA [Gammaproteobacteria bacterium]